MSALFEFLRVLLSEGRAVVRPMADSSGDGKARTLELLERAYQGYRLQVAPPEIAFAGEVALAAGELVRQAAWFLVSHAQPVEELERRLVMPGPPRSAAEHLSADLVLRFLPAIHRRAHALDPADRLPHLLAGILRQWPLTGALADVAEGPLTSLEEVGHPGLLLLYAERLAQNDKPAWVPGGRGLEYVELARADLGLIQNPLGAVRS
jgi:hypothetical protein